MLAERLEEWAHGYKAEGMQQGRQEGEAVGLQKGEALALQRLISRRFGAVPAEITARIAGAAPEQIELWLDQVLDAGSLGDMFGPTTH